MELDATQVVVNKVSKQFPVVAGETGFLHRGDRIDLVPVIKVERLGRRLQQQRLGFSKQLPTD